jgi:hypothetical protein
VNVVTDIRMMRTTVTILVAVSVDPMKVEENGAPKMFDDSISWATAGVIGPIAGWVPSAMPLRLLSTVNSAKKNGDCSRIGRHEENGLVPVFL